MARIILGRIRHFLVAPVYEGDDEKTQMAGLLNTVLLSFLAVLLVYAMIAPLLPNPERALPIVAVVILICGTSLLLVRSGRVRPAGVIFSVAIWLYITVVSVFFDGVNGVPFVTYLLVVVLGGMLVRGWGAFLFAGLGIAAGLGMYWAGENELLPTPLGSNPPLTRFAATALLMVIAALLVHITIRWLSKALQRARSNEYSLAESNRELVATRASLEQRNTELRLAVQRYVEYMAAVAGGNLSIRLSLREDEHAEEDALMVLGHNLNETTASLQRMTQQIHDTAAGLGSAVAEILAAAAQQAAGASEQSAAIAQASATIDQVRAVAGQASHRAEGVAKMAQRVTEISSAGQRAVAATIDGMQDVREKVEVITQSILTLSEQAQAIGAIISAVREIAAQSNLLALNAAVEAARAGEAGRGFAVVAAEVRALSEQSRLATEQVRAILTEIQHGMDTAVLATEDGMKGVAAGMKLAREAGEAIQRLAEGVVESAQASAQIAAAASQQLAGVGQIAEAMENTRQVAVQVVASTQQTEQVAGELNRLAGQLREGVEQYRL